MSGEIGLPATKRAASVSWSLEHNVGAAINPLGNTLQRIVRSGARWRASLQWPPMKGDDAGIMAGWLDRASRGDRWLYLDNPAHKPRGALTVENAVTDSFEDSGTADGWFTEDNVTVSVNARRLKVKNASGSPAVAGGVFQNITLEASKPHVVVVDFDAGDSQSATVQIRNATTFVVEASQKLTAAPGRFCFVVTPSQAAMQIRLVCNSDGHIYFRNITVTRCLQVNGSSQSGNRLNVDGLPASTNAVLKAGDMVCVKCSGSFELKRLVDDVDGDSSGAGALVFEPALRASPSDNEPVVLYRPFGRFLIPTHSSAVSSHPPADQPIHGFMFDAVEDVTPITDPGVTSDETGLVIWEFDASTGSLTPTEGSGTPTFTRPGATATRVNSSGNIVTVAADTPRFDYDPVTLAIKGLLIEEARTNLILRSDDFGNASWTKTDTTVTSDSVAGPDGATSMDLLTEGSAGTAFMNQAVTITADGTYTISLFMKRGNHDWAELLIYNGGAGVRAWYNLATGVVGSTGTFGTGSGVTSSIVSHGNGIYRCILTGSIGGGLTTANFGTRATTGDATEAHVANGTRYVYGAQFEAGAFATSYIPTTTASVTRNADNASALLSAISGWSATEGAFFVEATDNSQGAQAADAAVLAMSDGTQNEVFLVRERVSTAIFQVNDGGAAQANITAGAWANYAQKAMAGAWAANDFATSLAGAAAVTDASGTLPTVTTLSIGSVAGTGYFNGHIRKLRLYNKRLTNAQLQALTA